MKTRKNKLMFTKVRVQFNINDIVSLSIDYGKFLNIPIIYKDKSIGLVSNVIQKEKTLILELKAFKQFIKYIKDSKSYTIEWCKYENNIIVPSAIIIIDKDRNN